MIAWHRVAAMLPKRCAVFGDSLMFAGFATKARVKRRQQVIIVTFHYALDCFQQLDLPSLPVAGSLKAVLSAGRAAAFY